MKTKCCLCLTFIALVCLDGFAQTGPTSPYPTVGSIEVVDPALSDLIDPNAQIEVLADGFLWSEGPVWIEDGDYLLFSDIPNNRIVKWSQESGATTYLKPAGYTDKVKRGGEGGCNASLASIGATLGGRSTQRKSPEGQRCEAFFFTAKRLHSKAQGRSAAAHPG